MVLFSPTLNRDCQSLRKLFPDGCVDINSQDADAIGVREGRRVRLCSPRGEAVVPIRKRDDLARGTLLAPFEFRESLASVLSEDGITPVNIERV